MSFSPGFSEGEARVFDGGAASHARPPDVQSTVGFNDNGITAPRKRPREEFPSPVGQLSDLERNRSEHTSSHPLKPQGKSVETKQNSAKSYSSAAGARAWIMEDDVRNAFSPILPMHEDGAINPRCPRVWFSEEEIAQFYKPWSKALVVRVLEKSFPYQSLRRRLEFLWAKKGRIQVADLSNDFFLVRFSDGDDYQRAAFEGPWKMFDYYITVARWTPNFNEEEPIQTILTWVRLPKLPIHFFNKTSISRIGDHIGRTVRLGLATAEGAKARYARGCVEVDLSKPLLGKYMIGNRLFYVEYECLENLCYLCGMYGHKHDSCPDLAEPNTSIPVAVPPEVVEPAVAEEGDAGSWMTVSRRRKKKAGKQAPEANNSSGSRFSILQRDQGEVANEGVQRPGKAVVKNSPDPSKEPTSIESLVTITEAIFPAPKADEKGRHPKTPLRDISNLSFLGDQENCPGKEQSY
ncbi:hypothetical protein LINPERPRIM_LOCUS17256 [Linum perenne]